MAEGQPRVVKPQQPQDRGVEIVDRDRIDRRLVPVFVALAMRMPTPNPAAGEPRGEPLVVVVATVAAVQTAAVAIVGEYVVRTYREAQGRPTWVVRRTLGRERATTGTSRAA